jgi:hypothetical protein
VAETLLREVVHEIGETAALLAQQVRGGHPYVRERQLGRVLGMQTDLVQLAAPLEAGHAALKHQKADAVAADGRIGGDDGDDEVGEDAVADEGLGSVDDVLVALAPSSGADAGDVRPAAGLGHGERADLLAGQRGPHEAVDEIGRAVGTDVRQGDPTGEECGHQATGGARLEERLLHRDRVEQVTTLPADLLGERDAEQSLLRRGEVQLARDRAGVLPVLQVGRDLAADELAGGVPQRFAVVTAGDRLTGSRRAGRDLVPRSRGLLNLPSRRAPLVPRGPLLGDHRSDTSSATIRERTHSPSPLAWGSNRVEAATPSPSSPRIRTLTAPRLGST